MSSQTTQEFGKIRSLLWPVHNFELKKLLPMFLMFFFISFNYTILRDTKDVLVVTAAGSGAETLTFIKFWGVLPMAVVFMLIYAKLSNKLSKPALFYATVAPFIIFFALFAFVLYPAREHLHPTALCDKLLLQYPNLMGLIAIFRNWTFSLFYILAELWGSVVLSLLFWSFANDIMKVMEAKRFYSLLGLGANLALMVSGPSIIYASKIRANLPPDVDAWGVSLNYLMSMVVGAGILVMVIYYWINKNVLTDPRFYDPKEQKTFKKEKPKMSLKDSFGFLTRSKYLGLLALLVISYGIAINIIEVTWKSQLKLQYPNSNDYSAFMGGFSLCTGIVSAIMMFFIGGNLIRKLGWGFAAQTTPVVLLITGVVFLSFVIFRENLTGVIAMLGSTPLMLAVIVGMIQNILSKSTKYSLFDPTKEMAYIPLDPESKVKGKAAIDVVGARFGKSGGSLIQQVLIVGFGSIAAITPYLAAILFGVIAVWIIAARALNKLFIEKENEKVKQKITEEVIPTASKSSPKQETLN
ncbi:MAG: NTP/NDP exchange transporter [Chlamydiae bacterium]|nr:NTP/NDP exchange transporter [Chlamydiota bacterium]